MIEVRESGHESGFGLIEIVVSMFVLALVAVAFLPLVIDSLTLARNNVTLTTATQLANSKIAEARASVAPGSPSTRSASCAALSSAATNSSVTDARGVTIAATVSLSFGGAAASCPVDPTAYPTTVDVAVAVSAESKTLVTVRTKVLVRSP